LQFHISEERGRCALHPAGCVIEELVDDDDAALQLLWLREILSFRPVFPKPTAE